MKRCPECGRDYNDDSLSFCLDDGSELLFGPSLLNEPATAIILGQTASNEPVTTPISAATDRRRAFNNRSIVVGTLAIILLGALFAGGYFYYGRASTKQIGSIAVMPFVNDSGNPDVDYLSDGLTETLIGSLSKLGDLSVKARSVVFAYKGRETSPKQIGDELGVQAVLLGRLIQRGDNIKLNLELVNVKTQDVIWADQYDRRSSDLVTLQNEIARDVSNKLKLKLSGTDQQKLTKVYTNDPEAYRLYLQARFYLNKRVGKEYEKAEGYLRQAIDRDPNFALAYTGLAEFIGQRDRPKAKEYITRALAIDSELSDAHALLGFQYSLDRDWSMAERELKRALEIEPENWRALQWDAARQLMTGHYEQCLNTFDKAIAIEPTMADLRNNRGACLIAGGRIDDGIASIKDGMQVDPAYAWSFSHISFVYRMKGDRIASVEARARSSELLDRPDLAKRLRDAFASGGWTAYLRELLAQQKENYASSTRRASILAELGQKEEALKTLEEAAAGGDWWLFSIKYDPAFDALRGEPRFQAILKQFDPPK